MPPKDAAKPCLRGDPTRDKIICAARTLFVQQGYSGTAVSSIATRANINHSLIFHHFGNKQGLWIAVKQHIVDEAAHQSPTLPDTNRPFKDFLHGLLTRMIDFYHKHPDIVYLINWQRLESSQNRRFYVKNTTENQKWVTAFKHYQQQGDINKHVNLTHLTTMVSSIVSSASMDPYESLNNDKRLADYITFCVQRLLLTVNT